MTTMMTTTSVTDLAGAAPWRRVSTGDDALAVAERDALGTTARVAVWPPENLRRACAAVDGVLGELDLQASRFRPDSEISWLNHGGGGLFMLSDGLTEAVGVALAAARWTAGRVDPTVGEALIALGYDRDFAAIDQQGSEPLPAAVPAPGWELVELHGPMLRLPPGVRLDLGATAKGVGSDRAVWAARPAVTSAAVTSAAVTSTAGELAGGVLVSLGGDLAVAGTPPRDGWPVTVAAGPDHGGSAGTQLVRLPGGAVATSSVTCRQWRRGGRALHHIVDPRTGLPAEGPWQAVSAVAATCADANAATTAAIVAGPRAVDWLTTAGLPARLVARDGEVRYVGGWPAADGATLPVPPGTHVYGGVRRPGGWR
ncbi:MAG TPA: FAD:protein FMN transferase [Streptosporangiaceae bacterium]|nr:FAD:protein FMN transferase [Streptosporangiaceae bacterium]